MLTESFSGVLAHSDVDRFERREGGAWLIARRVCVWDHVCSGRHELWTLGPSYVPGRNDRQDPSYER